MATEVQVPMSREEAVRLLGSEENFEKLLKKAEKRPVGKDGTVLKKFNGGVVLGLKKGDYFLSAKGEDMAAAYKLIFAVLGKKQPQPKAS